MRKKVVLSLFLLTVFVVSGYLSANADMKKGCDKKKGACDISENLKLSKEQKAKFDDIKDECKKSRIKAGADIKALLRKENIDKGAVEAKVNELGDLIKKELKAKYDCKLRALSILDAEQKKLFLDSDCCGMSEGRHHGGYGKAGHGGCDMKGKIGQGEGQGERKEEHLG